MDLPGFPKVVEVIKVTARRWPVVLVCLLLGVGAGWAVTALTTPVHEARAQLFVAARMGGDAAREQDGESAGGAGRGIGVISQARVQSYAEIATTRRVTEPVVRGLELGVTPRNLANRITAEVPPGTVLIDIAVTDSEADRAARTANAVALRVTDVVEKLETPRGVAKSPVSLGVAQQATAPEVALAPRPVVNLAAGALGGLLCGLALLVLLEKLDTRIRTADALGELTALPVLGEIPFDRLAPGQPLATGESGHSPRGEAFRRLRTHLRFARVDERPQILVVTSALPGEGKTHTAANLALSLAESGVRTCLVDADLRRPGVAELFGLVQDAGLTTVLIGEAGLDTVMQRGPEELAVLAGGAVPPNPAELLGSEAMASTLRQLADRYEAVVLDSAPLLPVADTVGLAPLTQAALLVVRASATSRDQVRDAAATLNTVGVRPLGTVFSMSPEPKAKTYGSYDPQLPPAQPVPAELPGLALSYLAGDK